MEWDLPTAGPFERLLDAGTLAVAASPTVVAGIDPSAGTVKWTITHDLGPLQDLLASGDWVLLRGLNTVSALNSADGRTLWKRSLKEVISNWGLSGEAVVFSSARETLAIRVADGTEVGRLAIGLLGMSVAGSGLVAQRSPVEVGRVDVTADGLVEVWSRQGYLEASLDATVAVRVGEQSDRLELVSRATGALLWHVTIDGECSTFWGLRDLLLMAYGCDNLSGVSLTTEHGLSAKNSSGDGVFKVRLPGRFVGALDYDGAVVLLTETTPEARPTATAVGSNGLQLWSGQVSRVSHPTAGMSRNDMLVFDQECVATLDPLSGVTRWDFGARDGGRGCSSIKYWGRQR